MSDISALDKDLNELVLAGKALDGFDKYYADDVVMQENLDEPRRGKKANRDYEVEFYSSVEKVNAFRLVSSAVGDGVSFSEWEVDVVLKNGARVQNTQVARRLWKNGKIVDERFYYKPPA